MNDTIENLQKLAEKLIENAMEKQDRETILAIVDGLIQNLPQAKIEEHKETYELILFQNEDENGN